MFLDCAWETAVVAVGNGCTILGQRQWASRLAAESCTLEIDRLLVDAGVRHRDLDGLAWASGPGSFTGLKVVAATIQALAWVWGKPVASIPHLAALAYSCRDQRSACVVACRGGPQGRFFWCPYEIRDGQWPEGKVRVAPPDAIRLPIGCWLGVGDDPRLGGRAGIEGHLSGWVHEPESPVLSALALAELAMETGRLERPEKVQPLYVGHLV
jgi:tRNA threonylcarbamoyladenosine biosynthesis protein TsaB